MSEGTHNKWVILATLLSAIILSPACSQSPPLSTAEPTSPLATATTEPARSPTATSSPKIDPTPTPSPEPTPTNVALPSPTVNPVQEAPNVDPSPASLVRLCLESQQTPGLNGNILPPPNSRSVIPPQEGYITGKKGTGHGDVHYTTPDGLSFDFQASGEFIAIKDESDDLEIQVRQEPWGDSTTVSVNTAIAVDIRGDTIGIYLGQDPPLLINGEPTYLNGRASVLPNGGQVQQYGEEYIIVWPDQTWISIIPYGSYINFVVSLCPGRIERIAGLLGNFDELPENDFRTREGQEVLISSSDSTAYYQRLYRIFGDSWRISQDESLFFYLPGQGTQTFTDLDFPYRYDPTAEYSEEARLAAESVCRQAGVTEPNLLSDCILDVLVTGDQSFAEGAAQTEAGIEKFESLPDSILCKNYVEGYALCQDLSPVPDDILLGSNFEIVVETVIDAAFRTESFTCGPILPILAVDCGFKTKGLLFQGGKVTWVYTLNSGEEQEFWAILDCSVPADDGVGC